MSYAIKYITDDIFSFRKTAHWCTCIVCTTQCDCCGTLDFLSPEPCPLQQCRAERIDHKIRELYSSVSMSCESNRLKEIKNRLVEFWQCTVIQHLSEKMRFSCFPALPGSAEAQVTWGGTVKRILILLL